MSLRINIRGKVSNYWFQTDPKAVEDPRAFILSAIKQYVGTSPGEGGDALGSYLSGIPDKDAQEKFLTAIENINSDPSVESWIKSEIRIALDEAFKNTLNSVFDSYTLKDKVRTVKQFSSALTRDGKKKEMKVTLVPRSKTSTV